MGTSVYFNCGADLLVIFSGHIIVRIPVKSSVFDGGIAIYGSLIGAGIVVIYSVGHADPTWLMLDIAAPT